jgi:class 3 adenylate cyclase/predicted ATPase
MAEPEPAARRRDLEEWLFGLGLERFAHLFAQQEIELSLLPELTEADLRDLGIPMGPRKQILRAIAALERYGGITPSYTGMARPRQRADAAERRQLTVMFSDMVGSTALSARLDPEDLREVIGAYQRAVAEEVRRLGGCVARYMGDGAMIYFGYPQAHEDDAERAVLTGLALIDRVARLETHERLEIRIGIATGLAVVGDLIETFEAQERGVVGETPNLAARMQELAPANGIVIAEGTRRLLGSLFELRDLGALAVKGFDAPVLVWQVLRPSAVESRFEALRAGALTPLVGREDELNLLLGQWQRAKAGGGQVVVLSGDAGIGKSRLAVALRQHLEDVPHIRLRYYCSAHHQHSALYPFITQLERAAGFAREDAAELRLDKLELLLGPAAPPPEDLALLAGLLSLPTVRYLAPELAPRPKKERIFAALLRQFEALSQQQPVLIVFEDLHWIDPSSLELLDLTVERLASLPVLMIATCRPEYRPPWSGLPQVTALSLVRLDARAGAAIIARITGNRPLPTELAAEIVERADGVPLFVEELTRAVIEAEIGGDLAIGGTLARVPARSATVPATLHASLMARLDRLGPAAREIAQIGAVIGREFAHELLSAVAAWSRSELEDALDRLTGSGLVFRRGPPSQATFLFKHVLLRDAAYASLLRQRRQELHVRIAGVLETEFHDIIEPRPELVAHHLTLARQGLRALRFWQLAGQRAAQLSSYIEASHHFDHALELLRNSPDAIGDGRQELELMVALATVQLATQGYGAPEVAAAFSAAKQRCYELGGSEHLMAILFGEWACAGHRQPVADVVRLGRSLRRVAKSGGDVSDVLMGERAVGNGLLFAGRFVRARLYLQHAAKAYDEQRDRKLALRYGLDLLAASLSQLVIAEWSLGFAEAAEDAARRAIGHSERIEHGNSLALAIVHGGLFFEQFRNHPKAILQHADRLHGLAQGGGFRMFVAWGGVLEGWAKFQLGEQTAGIALMQEAIRNAQDTGSILHQPYFLTLLAECHGARSDFDNGLDAVAEALGFAQNRGEQWYAAEAYRLKGELLLRGNRDRAGAAAALSQAREVARCQRNVSLMPRIQVSIAELEITHTC